MPNRPLLILPNPARTERPRGYGGATPLVLPSRARQCQRVGPVFGTLQQVLSSPNGILSVRSDPSSIAPERAIVFEIAGALDDFYATVQRIQGLEFLADEETSFQPDADFAVKDNRQATKGQPRPDKAVG